MALGNSDRQNRTINLQSLSLLLLANSGCRGYPLTWSAMRSRTGLALALVSTARSRQDDVVFDNSRHPNFCSWLTTDSPAMSPVRLHLPQERTFTGRCPVSRCLRLLHPQEPTFWPRLGMSHVDPKATFTDAPSKFVFIAKTRYAVLTRWFRCRPLKGRIPCMFCRAGGDVLQSARHGGAVDQGNRTQRTGCSGPRPR
jgi:hypothetical protein